MKPRLHRSTLNVHARSEDGVERSGESRAPTAFRIWRAGENKADDGSIFFTADSAKTLMDEQASRGRVMAIDFDHLSLVDDRPATSGCAAGWHRIEARDTDDGPELWAVDVEWCADAKAGLEEEPPKWRFFSPAFYTDEDQQVTSYINLALCINPMTHGIPLLASRKLTQETPMPTAEEMLSALDALIESTTDETQKAALVAAREALASKKGEDAPSDPAPVEASEKSHAEGGDDDKKDEDKSDMKAHAAKTEADPVASLTAQVMQLQRDAELGKIEQLLAKNASLPEEAKAHCRKGSLADAKAFVTAVTATTRTHATRKTAPSQGAPDGASEMDPREAAALDRAMGMPSSIEKPFFEKRTDGTAVFHNVRPSELARMNAQKGKV
jgi:phage I-like protein